MRGFIMLVLITFCVGLMVGVYAYGMLRTYEPNTDIAEEWNRGAFEIVAESYGGCAHAGCASYRLRADGVYTFIQEQQGDDARYEDVISKKQLDALRVLVDDTALAALTQSEATGRCPVSYDGTAYRFDIYVDGTTHHVDTCTHDLVSVPLIGELRDYFQIFYITHVR